MKKLLLLLTLAVFAFESNAQEARPVCPFGYEQVGGGIRLDIINFHKPRTNCVEKFGFCVRFETFAVCQSIFETIRVPVIHGLKVQGYFNIKNDTATLYLPLALRTHEEFRGQDMSLFYVERNAVSFKMADDSWQGYLREGAYPVEETTDALVIKIPIE